MRMLNLGAGTRPEPGAVNHDRTKHGPHIDVAHDLNVLPWPWLEASFDRIIARSVLEHLRLNLVEAADECWRVLRPGGELYLKLPHWRHDNAYTDPTHYWRYSLHSCDVLDPDTEMGREYGFYTDRKWAIVRGPKLNGAGSSIFIVMKVRK